MITIRPIGACGPIADCSICETRDITNLCVYWESSEVFEIALLELGNGCLVCVPNYCDESIAYAYPLDTTCSNKVDKLFNCTDEDLFETVVCAPSHGNVVYAAPCGPVGTRGQWVRETYCCSREAA